jgi:1-acyl-sn-glycerol-3-phosphate acyltransferase
MRILIIFLFLIIYYFISIPFWIAGFFIGLKNPVLKHRLAQTMSCTGFRVIIFLGGITLTVKGKKNCPDGDSALFVYNHRGFFDIICGYVLAPSLSFFVAKKELMHIPLISRWMRYMDCLFLDRGNIKQGMETINKGIELLKEGKSCYIAPEGTRSKTDEMLEFHEASFRLALKAKKPIVPVAITNSSRVFEDHLPFVRSTHMVYEYLEPIYAHELERSEQKHIGAATQKLIQSKVYENLEVYNDGKKRLFGKIEYID